MTDTTDVPTHRFALGSFECTIVSDGALLLPAAITAPSAPPRLVAQELRANGDDPTGLLSYEQNILLVNTGTQLVLIDTGTGGSIPGTGRLVEALRALGVAPGDIGVVVITHAHFDHIGGVVTPEGAPAFPNARIVLTSAEHSYWAADPSLVELAMDDDFKNNLRAAPAAILPVVAHQLDLVAPGTQVVPGITVLSAFGHTPGHAVIEVASDGHRLVYLGDSLTLPMQLRHDDWLGPVETWPAHSVPTRRALLARAADEHQLLVATHFPFPGLGRVTRVDDSDQWRWASAAEAAGETPTNKSPA